MIDVANSCERRHDQQWHTETKSVRIKLDRRHVVVQCAKIIPCDEVGARLPSHTAGRGLSSPTLQFLQTQVLEGVCSLRAVGVEIQLTAGKLLLSASMPN